MMDSNTEYIGNDGDLITDGLYIESAEKCRVEVCLPDKSCDFWSFDEIEGKCYTWAFDVIDNEPGDNFMSGRKICY